MEGERDGSSQGISAPSQLPQRRHQLPEDRKRSLPAEAAWSLRRQHGDRPAKVLSFFGRQVGHGGSVANWRSYRYERRSAADVVAPTSGRLVPDT
jgi:hypothetical protein